MLCTSRVRGDDTWKKVRSGFFNLNTVTVPFFIPYLFNVRTKHLSIHQNISPKWERGMESRKRSSFLSAFAIWPVLIFKSITRLVFEIVGFWLVLKGKIHLLVATSLSRIVIRHKWLTETNITYI